MLLASLNVRRCRCGRRTRKLPFGTPRTSRRRRRCLWSRALFGRGACARRTVLVWAVALTLPPPAIVMVREKQLLVYARNSKVTHTGSRPRHYSWSEMGREGGGRAGGVNVGGDIITIIDGAAATREMGLCYTRSDQWYYYLEQFIVTPSSQLAAAS